MKDNIDELRTAIIKSRVNTIINISKINDDIGMPYFDNRWLHENILNIKEIYCPWCLKYVSHYNDMTFAPECSCGWTVNMLVLLTEEKMNRELRRRKIDKIEKYNLDNIVKSTEK